MSTTIILWYMKFTRMIFPPVMLVRVDLVEHALGLLVIEVAAGVLELVGEFLHPLVEFLHLR